MESAPYVVVISVMFTLTREITYGALTLMLGCLNSIKADGLLIDGKVCAFMLKRGTTDDKRPLRGRACVRPRATHACMSHGFCT